MHAYPNTMSPYAAAPQMAPYGAVGDFFDQHGRQLGQAIGSHWGQGGLGGDIGDFAGNLAGRYLPFSAGPQMAPYGVVGDFLDQHGRGLGNAIGNIWGQGGVGGDIGDFAGNLAGRYLPFSAGPAPVTPQPELVPYSAFGNFMGAIAPGAGRMIGRAFGNEQLGSTIGQAAGAVSRFLPFSAGEQAAVAPQQYYQPAPQQMAPYGIGGMLLGAVAPAAGAAIGGLFGNKKLGRQIGTGVGIASSLLPFSTGPGQVAYLPVDYPTVH